MRRKLKLFGNHQVTNMKYCTSRKILPVGEKHVKKPKIGKNDTHSVRMA
jgi:hypothetical protein